MEKTYFNFNGKNKTINRRKKRIDYGAKVGREAFAYVGYPFCIINNCNKKQIRQIRKKE